MRNSISIIIICLILAISWTVFSISLRAQNVNVDLIGKVIDSRTGSPLEGAVIHIKGTTHEVATDIKGEFKFVTGQRVPVTYIISLTGYTTKEFNVTEYGLKVFELKETDVKLDEVVVVGYGSQRKKDIVGSITKVDPSSTKYIPDASFDAQIQGKTAGVQINTNSGVPGSNVFIRVRGATSINAGNEPLYIIDGVFVNSSSPQGLSQDRGISPLSDINPNDIESIEILKDASAIAIYGSRGANGVIIVTTKRGNFEQKSKVNFSATHGLSWAPSDRIWKTTTGSEHALLVNEFNRNMNRPLPFRAVSDGGRGLPEEQPTFDRMSILNRVARLQNYDLSIQGGAKNTKYYVGGGYNKQEAIWKPMSFERLSFKVNLDQKINEKLNIGVSNIFTRSFRNMARPANGGLGTLLQSSLNIPTYLPIFLNDGTPAKWVNFDNIHVLTSRVNIKATSYRTIGNFYAEYDLLKDLKFRSSWSLDYNLYDEYEYWQRGTVIGGNTGRATSSITQNTVWVNEQTLSYKKKILDHKFNILFGNTLQGNLFQRTLAQGTNFPNDNYTLISQASIQTAQQRLSKNNLASFFSRIDYSYRNKYFLEAVLRADGSSKFGKNNKWGYYPSIGLAWNIKEENILKEVDYLSNLKFRTSYGVTGNQNGIPDFPNQGLWTGGFGYPDGNTGGEGAGIAPLQLVNNDLKWESTTQYNIGLDLGFLKDKINIEFNYYNKYTRDLLVFVPLPTTSGFNSILQNFGEVSNKGFEFVLSTKNIDTKEFLWKTDFNISRNINTVEKIPAPINYAGRDLIRLEEGKPLYSYWLYNQLNVDRQTGNAVFEDLNKDGQITASDRKILGNTWPKFFGGLTNTLRYKNLDLNIHFTFQYGNNVWNHNRMLGETGGTLDANRVLLASQLDRWTTPGQITNTPKLTADNYARQENSRFFEDGSFLRLRNISFGYSLPKKIINAARFQDLRFFLTASNLFLFTKYTGSDPETNLEPGGESNIQGYDYALPPMPRSVQFGFNLSF